MPRTYIAGVVGLGLLAVVACAPRGGTIDETAAAGDDMAQTEGDMEALATLHVGSTSSGALAPASLEGDDLHLLGGDVSSAFTGYFSPSGCVTETASPDAHKVTYDYSDCTGPWGLAHLTGTVEASYSSTGAGNLTLDFSATDFQVNRATLSSWSATTVITAAGSSRTMDWNAQLSGATGDGRSFTRKNQKTITWTPGGVPFCVSVAGVSQGTVTGLDLKTTVTAYQRCEGACPASGSEISVQNVTNGDEVDIKYEGGPAADVTLTVGRKTDTITLPLACSL
jgi:hypothetical protein